MSLAKTCALLGSPLLLASTFLQAQEAPPVQKAEEKGEQKIGQTIVTARKVEEPVADVPVSASVVTGEDIQQGGLQSVAEAAHRAPNVHYTEFTSRRLSFPFIRGIGSGQGDPAVVTYVDGVPQLSNSSTNLPFLDVERIEFLRGPQGTLYGRNALGGLVHVITEPPSMEAETSADMSFGEFNFEEYRLSATGPLDYDNLAFRLGGMYSRRDGFTTNDFTGNDLDSRDEYFGRGQLLFTPDKDTAIDLSLSGETARDGGFALGFLDAIRDNPHHVSQDFEGKSDRDIVTPSITWREKGDATEFTSITAYEDWSILETSDFDFSVLDGVRRKTKEDQQYLYQELRWSSLKDDNAGGGNGWDLSWLAGMSGFNADSDRYAQNDLRPGGVGILFPVPGLDTTDGEFDDLGLAGFASTSARKEAFEVTVGVRYDYEQKEAGVNHTFDTGGFQVLDDSQSLDESFDEFVPQASLAWHFDKDSMLYTSAARGFKAGGFNLSAPSDQLAFDPETNTSYELGYKTAWPASRIQLAASVFYIDWNDMQLSLFDAQFGGFVDNAGESTSQGFELEAAAEVMDGLTVNAGFGYTDTEFDKYTDPYGVDVSGNDLTFAPESTFAVGLQYMWETRRDLRPFVRADWTDVGKFFYDPQNLESESYQLLDLRVGVESQDVSFSVWAKNALDEEYVPVAFQASPTDPSVFVGESGPPRMIGATLRFTF
jgi:iron complex outermembrane receptor protein